MTLDNPTEEFWTIDTSRLVGFAYLFHASSDWTVLSECFCRIVLEILKQLWKNFDNREIGEKIFFPVVSKL